MSQATAAFNETDVRRFFALLQGGDAARVIELRCLHYGGRKSNTFSGYFNGVDAFVEAACHAAKHSGSVYATVNELNPQLLARRGNRAEAYADLTTADADVIRRRFIPVDLDAIRPAGTSASDAQHEAALAKAREIHRWMKGEQWADPVVTDSGNGAHLLIPMDEPNTEESKTFVQGVLSGLHEQFSDSVVKVDVSVCNPARIMRLPGCLNRKGDNLPDYPHRIAKLLYVPEALEAHE